MTVGQDLLALALELVPSGRSRPKEVRLRRALSCAYYAMFHSLARTAADSLIGSTKSDRADRAWQQVYRSLGHGDAAKRCEEVARRGADLDFPSSIITFARQVKPALDDRHSADYDPGFKPSKGSVLASILAAESTIAGLEAADLRHKKAFSAFVLFKRR